MQIPTTQPKLLEIAEIIASPSKMFYSPFPEFTPLEFEHFCAFLLQKDNFEILHINKGIEADGGIDLIVKKHNQIAVVQVKKSEWKGVEKDYISLDTVDRVLGTMARNESKLKLEHGQECEVVAYFMTLRRFSSPTKMHFKHESRVKLIDLNGLKKMIHETGLLDKETTVIVWTDQELEAIKNEIEILENLVAEREIHKENLKSKIQQLEKIVMLELLDLNRLLDLKKSELEYLKQKVIEITAKAYEEKQQKIEEEYDNLENEYIEAKIEVLEPAQEEELKNLYRKLQHLYHPDKHLENKTDYDKISKIINQAKDEKNIEKLKDIESNPHKYFDQNINQTKNDKAILAKFVESLKHKLIETSDIIDELENTSSYKLYTIYSQDQGKFTIYLQQEREKLECKIQEIEIEIKSIVL